MPDADQPRNLIGLTVQKLRSERGWSQTMLATKCQLVGWDISRSIVAAIEGRVRWIGDWEILLLARVFEIPVSQIFPSRVNWVEFKIPPHPKLK